LITAAFLLMQAAGPPAFIAIVLMVIAVIGHTTSQPASAALVSKAAAADQQGATLGANNAASAAARVAGPVAAGLLFSTIGSWAPFVFAALLIAPAGALAWLGGQALARRRDPALESGRTRRSFDP
jgi:predicted MFS family arabinose efflux permease